MKLDGALTLKGVFTIRHYRDGKLLDEEEVTNTVTNAGKAGVAQLMNGVGSDQGKWLAVGSSSTAIAAADTTLNSEHTAGGLGRASATCTTVTTDVSGDTAQLVHTWTATATKTVRSAGIFDTSTANTANLWAGQTFSAKNMETDDTLEITYKVDID